MSTCGHLNRFEIKEKVFKFCIKEMYNLEITGKGLELTGYFFNGPTKSVEDGKIPTKKVKA